jgi:UDP-N-acetylmuramyl-tripeptide synthetase/UDP-N-acetylmuramoyl-tripeptide--D-alanyl-D-alanine ligase
MVTVAALVSILKENQLWITDQSISPGMVISGKPVTDSRLIKPGDAFICIRGFQSDGHKYIPQAREGGVSIIISEDAFQDKLPAIRVSNSRKAAALYAKLYYRNPTSKFTLIGVTGTNGKTTTSLLIWQALTFLGKKTGWIGTLGYKTDSEIIETNNTTPDVMELHSIFNEMVTAGCEYVVMEVSSHALALDRVFGLDFSFALFTNLSRDHLDFHKDMSDYFENKYKLFEYTMKQNGTSIINIDDEYGKIIDKRISAISHYRKITISEENGDITIESSKTDTNGCYVRIRNGLHRTYNFGIDLVGHFNMLNAIMAIALIKAVFTDLSAADIEQIAAEFKPVRGRLEQVENDKNIGIYIDYAHTPDALQNVLQTLSELNGQRIITVFGAGGDRDRGKRPEMLQKALVFSDAVIITDDNPRTESPSQIIREIVGDTDIRQPWWIIRNRRTAIETALRLAQPGDIVLLAGKGHETYQEVEGVKHHFDDREVAIECLQADKALNQDELTLPVDPVLLEILFKAENHSENNQDRLYKYISTDSRTIKAGSLYFALKGETFDGMNYVDAVLADTSNGAVVNVHLLEQKNIISCQDTQLALGKLAGKYLQMFSVHKIALTGSTGKTTTKEYLANIMSVKGKLLKTHANENNIIGLSKTIFRIRPDDKTAVFELGTNHFGEIGTLTDICRPDIAMITNIGPSHLEFLGSEEGVYKEKTAIFNFGATTIVFPGDDERFSEFWDKGKGVGFSEQCDYRIENIENVGGETRFSLAGNQWSVKQTAQFMVSNVAFAIAAAIESGLSNADIQTGLSKSLILNQRMEIRKYGNLIVINDCYNANPVSMQAAIEFWHNYLSDKAHIAVLGDMLELGERAPHFHKEVGNLLNRLSFNELVTVGDLSKYYTSGFLRNADFSPRTIRHYNTVDELLIQPLLAESMEEIVVLIKASHGIKLDKVVAAIEREYTEQNPDKMTGL